MHAAWPRPWRTPGKAQLVVAHVWERPDGAEQVLQAALADAEAAGVKRLEGELHGGRSPADVLIELAESKRRRD